VIKVLDYNNGYSLTVNNCLGYEWVN